MMRLLSDKPSFIHCRCLYTGGKDSTVLAHVLSLLNQRHDYGLKLFLLSVDEGITGYRYAPHATCATLLSTLTLLSDKHQIMGR